MAPWEKAANVDLYVMTQSGITGDVTPRRTSYFQARCLRGEACIQPRIQRSFARRGNSGEWCVEKRLLSALATNHRRES